MGFSVICYKSLWDFERFLRNLKIICDFEGLLRDLNSFVANRYVILHDSYGI